MSDDGRGRRRLGTGRARIAPGAASLRWGVLLLVGWAALLPVPTAKADPPDPPALDASADSLDLPSAETIFTRYVDAIGGRDAYTAVRSIRMTGRFELPAQGMSGTLEMFAAAPDRFLMRIDLPGLGVMASGFDGTVGWMLQPMTGPMLVEGDALESLKEEADFYNELKDAADYDTVEVREVSTAPGEPSYKVRLVRAGRPESFEFYSLATGLLTARRCVQDSPMGRVDVFTRIGGYRRFGALLLPTLESQELMGMEQRTVIDSVAYDAVDPAVFVLPEEIRTLVRSREETHD